MDEWKQYLTEDKFGKIYYPDIYSNTYTNRYDIVYYFDHTLHSNNDKISIGNHITKVFKKFDVDFTTHRDWFVKQTKSVYENSVFINKKNVDASVIKKIESALKGYRSTNMDFYETKIV